MGDGERRQITNAQVRKWLHISTVETELRSRRLKWWLDITERPYENKQLLAALFGTTDLELRMGRTLEPPPWVQQLVQDVLLMAP